MHINHKMRLRIIEISIQAAVYVERNANSENKTPAIFLLIHTILLLTILNSLLTVIISL